MNFLILSIILLIALISLGLWLLKKYLSDIRETNAKITWTEKRHYTMLRIAVPHNNEKSPLAAEQMFAALHGIYRQVDVMQEHFSFEIAATSQSIHFYMLVPTHLRDFIEGQVYAQYPTVEIETAVDYAKVSLDNSIIAGTELLLTKSDYYPIKTFANFDVDPLAGITGVLSKLEEGELLSVQIIMSPVDDSWQKDGLDYVRKTKEGKPTTPPPLHHELGKQGLIFVKGVSQSVVTGIFRPPAEPAKEEKKEVKLSGPEELALKGIENKVTKLGYAVTIRILAVTPPSSPAAQRVEAAAGAFKQFNQTNLNGFSPGSIEQSPEFLRVFRSRSLSSNAYRMNVEEIASLFHFPDSSVATPNIAWAGSKKGEPPQNLPIDGEVPATELTTFGLTNFRNRKIKFGIKSIDRRLHFYVIGKTGTGKSTLIENMIYDDIKEGRGVAVVDPHGELIEHIMNFIPDERINQVVYLNPDDRENPLAFNLLESIEGDMRNVVASGLMSIFTKLWANVWSARMEYILRNAILAVLEVPDATLLSIMRVLNDANYRKYVLSCVTDPVVKDFFINEYERYDAKFRQEAIAPIQNKVGQFLSSSTIRNIVGQPKSTFDLSEMMDSGKILLVNLSIGRIGEDNSKLLGSMMITKIQLAAMSRARVSEDQRKDFYLYVDEFQNFATDSFATILSEARKYHLNLVLVNQYIAQIPEVVSDAIFGNVGTMVSFRVGPDDATKLAGQYAPVFEINDLVNLPNRQVYIKMAIDGVTSQSFSAFTLPPRGVMTNNADRIIEESRRNYAHNRDIVEESINRAATDDFISQKEQTYVDLRQYRPLIMDSTVYKEFSAKGGDRWYFGQPENVLNEDELAALSKMTGKTYPKPLVNELTPTDAENEEIVPYQRPNEAIVPRENTIIKPPRKNDDRAKKVPPIPRGGGGPAKKTEPVLSSAQAVNEAPRERVNQPAEEPMTQTPTPEPTPVPEAQTSAELSINRGQQHDDWLPIDEID